MLIHVSRRIEKTGSRYRGVYWRPTKGQWGVRIRIEQRLVYLGSYPCEGTAAMVWNDAVMASHSSSVHLNDAEEYDVT